MILLFVPAHNEEYIRNAKNIRKDYVQLIYDLEDSVPISEKKLALENIKKYAGSRDWVRIDERYHYADELPYIGGIVIPKVSLSDIEHTDRYYKAANRVAIIETAEGLEYARKVAKAFDFVIFGHADLACSLKSDEFVDFASKRILLACKAAGTRCYNTAAMSRSQLIVGKHAYYSWKLGFDGLCALHPDEISTIKKHFGPNDSDKKRAKSIAEAKTPGISVLENGSIIGPPIIERAEQILK